jgi:hypothetical protein
LFHHPKQKPRRGEGLKTDKPLPQIPLIGQFFAVIAEQTEPLLSSKLLYRSLEDVSSASLMVTYTKYNSEKL